MHLSTQSCLYVEGSVVAITGASSGIGKATALRLEHTPTKVILGARGESGLAGLSDEMNSKGGEAAYLLTDVSKRDDCQQFVVLAETRFGRLDILFSKAGAMPIGPNG